MASLLLLSLLTTQCVVSVPISLRANSELPSTSSGSSSTFSSHQPFFEPFKATTFLSPTPTAPFKVLDASRSPSSSEEVVTEIFTATVTDVPSTVTLPAPTITVTDVITESATPSSASTWVAPPLMTDLTSFNVTSFADGFSNMHIVQAVPPDANPISSVVIAAAPTGDPSGGLLLGLQPPLDGNISAIQVLYPAGSINPAQKPQGGSDFYASPLSLTEAENVTLEYSVFFPSGFDWVLGGKLPGLYGGHKQCSGGNSALSCFSTRLMWRQDGAGELYLYAPKTKQTVALCAAKGSHCNADYGLSVGRGSFNFTPGAWTHVKQTVGLNTPGETNGRFTLLINGQQVLNRDDIFYRGVPTSPLPSQKPTPAPAPAKSSSLSSTTAPKPTPSSSDDGGLLGGILNDVDGLLGRDIYQQDSTPPLLSPTLSLDDILDPLLAIPGDILGDVTAPKTPSNSSDDSLLSAQGDLLPVGFTGLFFR